MDRVVSAVNFEGEVYIFTERGEVFKMYKDYSGQVVFQRVANLPVR